MASRRSSTDQHLPEETTSSAREAKAAALAAVPSAYAASARASAEARAAEAAGLVALRFLEWARAHPGGVCCLPTGRTPEHFIAHTRRLLGGWAPGAPAELREELRAAGLDPDDGAPGPRLDSLRFVQMDEFFPVDPAQTNSFRRYVERYYLDTLSALHHTDINADWLDIHKRLVERALICAWITCAERCSDRLEGARYLR